MLANGKLRIIEVDAEKVSPYCLKYSLSVKREALLCSVSQWSLCPIAEWDKSMIAAMENTAGYPPVVRLG